MSPSRLEPLLLLWAPGAEAGSSRSCVVFLFPIPPPGSKSLFWVGVLALRLIPATSVLGYRPSCVLYGLCPLCATISWGPFLAALPFWSRDVPSVWLGPHLGVSAGCGLRVLPVSLRFAHCRRDLRSNLRCHTHLPPCRTGLYGGTSTASLRWRNLPCIYGPRVQSVRWYTVPPVATSHV